MHRYLCTVTAAAMLVVAACSNEAKDVFAPDKNALSGNGFRDCPQLGV
ncbi:MAG TPA: hypothetical protein VMQ73_11985 [Methylomirabilota bacterium]|nr:hypothetical protein [Methylomirabilota bacterium]